MHTSYRLLKKLARSRSVALWCSAFSGAGGTRAEAGDDDRSTSEGSYSSRHAPKASRRLHRSLSALAPRTSPSAAAWNTVWSST